MTDNADFGLFTELDLTGWSASVPKMLSDSDDIDAALDAIIAKSAELEAALGNIGGAAQVTVDVDASQVDDVATQISWITAQTPYLEIGIDDSQVIAAQEQVQQLNQELTDASQNAADVSGGGGSGGGGAPSGLSSGLRTGAQLLSSVGLGNVAAPLRVAGDVARLSDELPKIGEGLAAIGVSGAELLTVAGPVAVAIAGIAIAFNALEQDIASGKAALGSAMDAQQMYYHAVYNMTQEEVAAQIATIAKGRQEIIALRDDLQAHVNAQDLGNPLVRFAVQPELDRINQLNTELDQSQGQINALARAGNTLAQQSLASVETRNLALARANVLAQQQLQADDRLEQIRADDATAMAAQAQAQLDYNNAVEQSTGSMMVVLQDQNRLTDMMLQGRGSFGRTALFTDQEAANARNVADSARQANEQIQELKQKYPNLVSDADAQQSQTVYENTARFADQAERGAQAFDNMNLSQLLGQQGGGPAGEIVNQVEQFLQNESTNVDNLQSIKDAMELVTGQQTTASEALTNDIVPALAAISQDNATAAAQSAVAIQNYIKAQDLAGKQVTEAGMLNAGGLGVNPNAGSRQITVTAGQTATEAAQANNITVAQLLATTGALNVNSVPVGTFTMNGGTAVLPLQGPGTTFGGGGPGTLAQQGGLISGTSGATPTSAASAVDVTVSRTADGMTIVATQSGIFAGNMNDVATNVNVQRMIDVMNNAGNASFPPDPTGGKLNEGPQSTNAGPGSSATQIALLSSQQGIVDSSNIIQSTVNTAATTVDNQAGNMRGDITTLNQTGQTQLTGPTGLTNWFDQLQTKVTTVFNQIMPLITQMQQGMTQINSAAQNLGTGTGSGTTPPSSPAPPSGGGSTGGTGGSSNGGGGPGTSSFGGFGTSSFAGLRGIGNLGPVGAGAGGGRNTNVANHFYVQGLPQLGRDLDIVAQRLRGV